MTIHYTSVTVPSDAGSKSLRDSGSDSEHHGKLRLNRWRSQSMRNLKEDIGPVKYVSSLQQHTEMDASIQDLEDDDRSLASRARETWMKMDAALKPQKSHSSVSRELRLDRRGSQSMRNLKEDIGPVKYLSSPQLHTEMDDIIEDDDRWQASRARETWKKMDAALMPQKSHSSVSRPRLSSIGKLPSPTPVVDRWGEGPRNVSTKLTNTTPGRARMKWTSSEWISKMSPMLSSPISVHSKFPSPNTQRLERPAILALEPELNTSMWSLSPQVPQRRSTSDSITSPNANKVLRGHRVFNLGPVSKNGQVQNCIPTTPKPQDESSSAWIGRSSKDILSRSHHPTVNPEKEDVADSSKAHTVSVDGIQPELDETIVSLLAKRETNQSQESLSSSSRVVHPSYTHRKSDDKCHAGSSRKDFDAWSAKDEDLQGEDPTKARETVVDRVPKKRWSSKNIENFPIWPPVVKVMNFEKRNTSGISIGSGFSEDLTASEGDWLSSLGDGDLSVEAEMALLLPEQQTSYRIRYDGPTNLKKLNEIYSLPPVPAHDDRFGSVVAKADECPHLPSRSSKLDLLPHGPRRGSSVEIVDDASIDTDHISHSRHRPDVWITPLEGDTIPNAVWKVKRVWAVEREDNKETEHSVHNVDLFRKIKTLVGALDSPSSVSSPAGYSGRMVKDNIPRKPNRSWYVLSVVERNGHIDNFEAEKELSDEEMEENLNTMAREAIKEIKLNQEAIEEAKKRILMLKDANLKDQQKTPRRSRTMLLHKDDHQTQDEKRSMRMERAEECACDGASMRNTDSCARKPQITLGKGQRVGEDTPPNLEPEIMLLPHTEKTATALPDSPVNFEPETILLPQTEKQAMVIPQSPPTTHSNSPTLVQHLVDSDELVSPTGNVARKGRKGRSRNSPKKTPRKSCRKTEKCAKIESPLLPGDPLLSATPTSPKKKKKRNKSLEMIDAKGDKTRKSNKSQLDVQKELTPERLQRRNIRAGVAPTTGTSRTEMMTDDTKDAEFNQRMPTHSKKNSLSKQKRKQISALAMVHNSDSDEDSSNESLGQVHGKPSNVEESKESKKFVPGWWQMKDVADCS